MGAKHSDDGGISGNGGLRGREMSTSCRWMFPCRWTHTTWGLFISICVCLTLVLFLLSSLLGSMAQDLSSFQCDREPLRQELRGAGGGGQGCCGGNILKAEENILKAAPNIPLG